MNEKTPALSQQQIYQRLAQLDEDTQQRISQKYYRGTRPWQTDGQSERRRRKKASSELKE